MKKHTLIVLILAFITSCSKNEGVADYQEKNNEDIIAYLAKNNLEAQKSASGLYFIIDEPGYGKQPTQTSNVLSRYFYNHPPPHFLFRV